MVDLDPGQIVPPARPNPQSAPIHMKPRTTGIPERAGQLPQLPGQSDTGALLQPPVACIPESTVHAISGAQSGRHIVTEAPDQSCRQTDTAKVRPFLIKKGIDYVETPGLMGPLYAHHGRDIESSNKVKERAPAVYRWIETMLRPPITDPETWDVPPEYFSIDALPDTLLNFLKLIGQNFVPEVKATSGLTCYNGWMTQPLCSTAFRPHRRYYELIRPCALPRYSYPWKCCFLGGLP